MSTMLDLVKERDKLKKEYEYIITRYDDMCYNCDECKEQRLDLISKESDVNRRISEIEDKLSKIDSGEKSKKFKKFNDLESESILKIINDETDMNLVKCNKLFTNETDSELHGLELFDTGFFESDMRKLLNYFKSCDFSILFSKKDKDLIIITFNLDKWED